MKCIIYVFSGTGNTRLIADLYKNFLQQEQGWTVDIQNLDASTTALDSTGYDIIGLGYPVHGFNSPKIMWDFCKTFPNLVDKKQMPASKNAASKNTAPISAVSKKPVFILKSSGEGLGFNNYSSQKIIGLLHRRGYQVLQERHYVMPYNMIFRHSPEMVKSEYLYAQKYAQLSCRQLQTLTATGNAEKVRYFPLRYWFVPIVRILWIYAKLQSPFMKVDKKKCINCGKCIKACPYGNITFDQQKQKFKFGTKCVLCVRCSFGCPTCAISIGLLNGWRINGDYRIKQTATDPSLEFPHFTAANLRGLKRMAYLKYYRRLDKLFQQNGIQF